MRLIEIAVSKLWFEVNKMFSYTSLSLPRCQYKFSSLSVILSYSVSSENMVLNQTISPSWFFSWFSSPVCNDIGEIIYWSLLGVKGIFTVIYSSLLGFIWNQHSNQLLVGSSAQLVEHCTGIAKVMPYFHYCSSTVYYCKDCFNSYSLLYPQFTIHSFSLFYSII